MAIQTKPNIQIPWAETGNKTSVSEAKVRQGWIAEIPPAEVENYYQNRQETGLMHIFQTGISQWDALTSYTAFKSYVQASDGNIYLAVNDNTGQNPLTTTNWRLLIDKASKLVNETRAINTGYGLQGGGNLTTDRSISLAPSGATAGIYGNATTIPQIQIDAAGRIINGYNQAIDFASPFNNKVFSGNGYQIFPGGFIMQWGIIDLPATGNSTSTYGVNLNILYPSYNAGVWLTPTNALNAVSGYLPILGAGSIAHGSFIALADTNDAAKTFTLSVRVRWVSIGW